MTIKHIVFSGGGPTGLMVLGTLQHLQTCEFWNIENIESIYATSAGALLGIILCLKYDWETLNNYFIKRPWQDAFPITGEQLLNAYVNKGFFDNKCFETFFKPLFDAKNIPLNITLYEFYKYSNITLHMFSLEINENKIKEISHITYPDLPLLTAIHMTCAIPMIITPVCFDGKCFVDGGIIHNYPLDNCVLDHPDKSEIMSFKNEYIESLTDETQNNAFINDASNLYDFVLCLIKNAILNLNINNVESIENEIICKTELISIDFLKKTVCDEFFRQKLLNSGMQTGVKFIEKCNLSDKNKCIINNNQSNIVDSNASVKNKSLKKQNKNKKCL